MEYRDWEYFETWRTNVDTRLTVTSISRTIKFKDYTAAITASHEFVGDNEYFVFVVHYEDETYPLFCKTFQQALDRYNRLEPKHLPALLKGLDDDI